jgi:excisionase family DNA binding protein
MTYHPDKIAYVIQEAAEAAGISERQLRRAMAAGDLRFYFSAGRGRIFPADLRAYLKGEKPSAPITGTALTAE